MLLLKTLKNEVQRDEVVIAEQRFELCLRGMIKKNLHQMEDQRFCIVFGATFFFQTLKVLCLKLIQAM